MHDKQIAPWESTQCAAHAEPCCLACCLPACRSTRWLPHLCWGSCSRWRQHGWRHNAAAQSRLRRPPHQPPLPRLLWPCRLARQPQRPRSADRRREGQSASVRALQEVSQTHWRPAAAALLGCVVVLAHHFTAKCFARAKLCRCSTFCMPVEAGRHLGEGTAQRPAAATDQAPPALVMYYHACCTAGTQPASSCVRCPPLEHDGMC